MFYYSCSIVIHLPWIVSSKSIYQLRLVQHIITGFQNNNNKKWHFIPFYQSFIGSEIGTKLILWSFIWLSFPPLLLYVCFYLLNFNQPQCTFWTSKIPLSVWLFTPYRVLANNSILHTYFPIAWLYGSSIYIEMHCAPFTHGGFSIRSCRKR